MTEKLVNYYSFLIMYNWGKFTSSSGVAKGNEQVYTWKNKICMSLDSYRSKAVLYKKQLLDS